MVRSRRGLRGNTVSIMHGDAVFKISLKCSRIRLRRAIRNREDAVQSNRFPLIFDPQTSGGLLASVPAAQADTCVEALHAAGFMAAAVVGEVKPESEHLESPAQ